jgi:very-short-patch-repair endonuclease
MDPRSRSAGFPVHVRAEPAAVDRYARVAEIAGRQRGLITHPQLLDAGFSNSAIARALAAGRLHRVHRGVYLIGHAVPPPLALELAALLYCGSTAVLSHTTAASLWRVLSSWTGPVEITVPDRRFRRRSGLSPHAAQLDLAEVTTRHGLRLTTPARTLEGLSRVLDAAALERATNEAEVLNLIKPRRHAPGITRSDAERELQSLLRRAGLPPDATNVRLHGHEVDAFYTHAKLILELDGYAFHRTRRAFEHDRRRDQQLTGYRVLRITWRQVTHEPEALVARVARSIA